MNTLRNNRTWIFLLIAIVLVGAFFARGQLTSAQTEETPTTTTETATAFLGDLDTSVSANGNLVPATEKTLAFGMSGQVDEVLVEVGDTVEAGDSLVKLDTTSLERAVSDAEQTVVIRQSEVDALNTDELVDAEDRVADAQAELDTLNATGETENEDTDNLAAIEAAELELADAEADLAAILTDQLSRSLTVAEAQLQQAQNQLDAAEAQLASAEMTAPIDGIISTLMVQEGDYVSGPVMTMFDPDSLVVELELDEIDLRELDEGVSAEMTIDALPSVLLDGTVDAIAVAPTNKGSDRVTYAVTVGLEDHDENLRNGMSAKVWLTTAEREDVLLVPNSAITADNDNGTYFVTVMEGDTRVRVEVTIGVRDRQFTEITSGLTSGDKVVLRSTQSVQEIELEGPGGPFGN